MIYIVKTGIIWHRAIRGSGIITEGSSSHVKTHYEYKGMVNKGIHQVYIGGKYDSHLLIPVIRKKD